MRSVVWLWYTAFCLDELTCVFCNRFEFHVYINVFSITYQESDELLVIAGHLALGHVGRSGQDYLPRNECTGPEKGLSTNWLFTNIGLGTLGKDGILDRGHLCRVASLRVF